MKKLIKMFIVVIILLFIFINIMIFIDNKNVNDISKNIKKTTNIDDITYINQYGDRYIVKDRRYLYLFDKKYKEIDKLDVKNVYDNKKKYDIVYRNEKFMYMDESKNSNSIIYKYYDIEDYELVDKIVVGGN